MKLPGPKLTIPVFILFIFITRLPQLASPYLLLDGDECLVALMAKHIYNGTEFPVFFWGQQYGFTLVECIMMLPFYAVLGINAIAVKLAMLSLWTIGVLFLYKTLKLLNKGNEWMPFLLIIARMPYIPERYPPMQQFQAINDFGIGLNPSRQELEQYFQFPSPHE